MKRTHVANIEEVETDKMAKGGFAYETRKLSRAAGGKGLGCAHYEVPAGKAAFPNHWHSAFEEALYILEGQGRLTIGKDEVEVRAGDYVALLPGPDNTHLLLNSGAGPLRYLAISGNAVAPSLDILGYPDSKKLSFASGVEPGKSAWRDGAWVMKLIKEDQPNIGYYDDEPRADE